MKILCTICMRSGSKGIKNKNLSKIGNKHLMYYTINKAILSEVFSSIAVSTDSSKILNLASKYGADGWFLRSKKLSGDKVGKLSVIKNLLDQSEKKFNLRYDYIVDLDITAPLRTVSDIKKAIKKIIKEKKRNLVTITDSSRNPYFNMIEISNGKPRISKKINGVKFVSRQDAPKVFDLSPSIFIWRRDSMFEYNKISSNTSLYYLPKERAIDIDTKIDLEFVKFLLRKNK